ncbi:flagellar hook-associated protein FlgK [mine drainage metagenome]|uniref:Flagellar hook-associated protein FlgK n=1 Tax=mine drainage metagenome TaxID=410659 RepID=A0A1J5QR04_9ZZZZ
MSAPVDILSPTLTQSLANAALLGSGMLGELPGVAQPLRPRRAAEAGNTRTAALVEAMLGDEIPFERLRPEITRGIETGISACRAAAAEAQVVGEFATALENLLGTPGSAAALETLIGVLAESGQHPASGIIGRARALSDGLKRMSAAAQALRGDADQAIAATVADINALLAQLAETCRDIVVGAACGGAARGLITLRDQQLALLFGCLDVVTFLRADGGTSIFTRGGRPLLDGGGPGRLEHQPGGAVSLNGQDLSQQISSGRLHGLLSLRDTHLLGLAGQLDGLAALIRDRINIAFNHAIALPRSAGAVYAGSRAFLNPEQDRLTVSGGDTALTLLQDDGTPLAAVSIIGLMRAHLARHGLPVLGGFSVAQLAQALDAWLRERLDSQATCAFLDDEGRLTIALPRGRLSWRDQRSTALDSRAYPDPQQPLGLSGDLAFSDQFGNKFALTLTPGDSLQGIAAKVDSFSGLKASILSQRGGHILRLNNPSGCDIALEQPLGAAAALAFLPCPQLPAADVTVDWDGDGQGAHLISLPFDDYDSPLGLDGPLLLRAHDGAGQSLALRPDQSLAEIAAAVNAQGGALSASLKGAGNRWIIRIGGQPGHSLWAEGPAAFGLGLLPPPDLSVHGLARFLGLNDVFIEDGDPALCDSRPLPRAFATFAPGCLILRQRGDRRQTIGLEAGLTLPEVSDRINGTEGLAQASLLDEGPHLRLRLAARDGGALRVSGASAGHLGLTDGVRGLRARPDLLPEMLPGNAGDLVRQALTTPVAVAQGLALPAGNRSPQDLARALSQRNRALVGTSRETALRQQIAAATLDQRRGAGKSQMNRDATLVNTLRDAFFDSASVLMGLGQLRAALQRPEGDPPR